MQNLKSKYNGWALITGASSGIGKEFVYELAAQGFDIALTARNQDEMTKIAKDVQSKYRVNTRIIPVDLTQENASKFVADQVSDLDIGLLITAAGIDEMGLFLDKDYADLQKMLRLNIDAPSELTHIFGQKMQKRSKNGQKSGIIMVSSLFAYQGIPHFAAYAATKAYILTLGEALHAEMGKKGIDVLTLSPGLTATPFAQGLKMNLALLPMIAQSPRKVARLALNKIGRKMSVVSGLLNKVYAWENRLIPRSWPVYLFGFLIGNAAASYHKKMAKKQGQKRKVAA